MMLCKYFHPWKLDWKGHVAVLHGAFHLIRAEIVCDACILIRRQTGSNLNGVTRNCLVLCLVNVQETSHSVTSGNYLDFIGSETPTPGDGRFCRLCTVVNEK